MQPSSHPAALLVDRLNLWKHQYEAVSKTREYIKAFSQGKTERAALVHMPTGTGKTRVIASLARYAPNVNCVLILAPRIALRKQLLQKLEERFFKRGVAKSTPLPKRVLELKKENLSGTARQLRSTVFVGTIQKLDRISATDDAAFQALLANVSLVIFDEGHYEPAISWSETIRRFRVPRILFTATPFRNDYKPFDVDDNYAYSYPFAKAVAARYVRNVVFEQRAPTNDPNTFVRDILDFYDTHLKSKGGEPRVIIRCDNQASIESIAKVLENNNREFVAIHENFKTNVAAHKYKSVPNPHLTPATFWVHQFKLLEGIDDERFQMVAMYERLENARQLIQQVGRVVRNTDQLPDQSAYVIDHHEGWHQDMWDRFRTWDQGVKPELQMLSLGRRTEAMLQENQPPAEYIGGTFRSRLDLLEVDISKELQLPRTVNLLQKDSDFEMVTLRRFLEYRFLKEDRVYENYSSRGAFIYMYLAYENSPFLKESYYLQMSHGIMVIRDLGTALAFYDSSGFLPSNTPEAGIGKAIESRQLRGLFPEPGLASKSKNSFLTMVSMRNSHLAGRAVRSRSFWAADVQETIPALDDHAQILKAVFGYAPDRANVDASLRTRRYVGFNRGRVSQAGDFCTLDEYLDWLDQVNELIDKGLSPLQAFDRFAAPEAKVKNPTPKNVLLDVYEIQENYLTTGDVKRVIAPGQPMEMDDVCQEVEDGKFNLTVRVADQSFKCPLTIAYDREKRRYRISPDSDVDPENLKYVQFDQVFHTKSGLPHEGVLTYLNRTQSFRVLPQTDNVIYVHGEFYRPVIKIGKNFDPESFQVGKTLLTFPSLLRGKKSGFEKGQQCLPSGEGWEPGSLFDLIDKLGDTDKELSLEIGEPEILVCDDMDNEMADFILADSKRRLVAFIHAKAADKPRLYSATAITQVCGQAMKNIHYLSMFNEEEPTDNLKKWTKAWTAPPWVKGSVKERIRRPRGRKPADVWKDINSIIRDPLARREVWLILGQTLSKTSLEQQLAKSTDEAVQAAILLHGTMASIASIDAKMRVFCCK
jgi:superfamily II DNA or RNA helicase